MDNLLKMGLRGRLGLVLLPVVAVLGVTAWSVNPLVAGIAVAIGVLSVALVPASRRTIENQQRLDALSRMQAVIEFEPDGTIITANENFLKTMGYELDEIVGRNHRMFVEGAHITDKEYQSLWDGLRRGESTTGTFERRNKSGEPVWIRGTYAAVLDGSGKTRKVVKWALDETANHAAALEALGFKSALENTETCLMFADNDYNITFMNGSMKRLLEDAEPEFRQDLPGFDASSVLGANIDQFHKDPAHQRRILQRATSAEMSLGGRRIRLAMNPILDLDGERVGSVVEWKDRSEEHAIESEVQYVVDAAKEGDLGQRIDASNKKGFFLQLSQGVNELLEVSDQVIKETVHVLGSIADGDLTQTIESNFSGSFQQLKEDTNATIDRLTDVLRNIKTASDSVKIGAEEISQGNTDLSNRTEEQAMSLEETASSMKSMTETVKQNANNASEANALALSACAEAEKGGAVVNQAVAAMGEIDASSKKISDIIGVIDEIAFQTNLLALNASVEAARAGEQGRGFAVVASEVRNLAGRSATAAKEIKELIEDSSRKVDDGSRLVNESGETLKQIVDGVKQVTDIVGDIANASQQQASGIEKVNRAVTQMDELTQQNAALVEEAAAASESMGEQAQLLNRLIGFFTVSGDERAMATERPAAPVVQPGPPGGVERRSADRAWSQAPKAESAVDETLESGTDVVNETAAKDFGSGQQWAEF